MTAYGDGWDRGCAFGGAAVAREALDALERHESAPDLTTLDDVRERITVCALIQQGWSADDALELWRVSVEILSASDVGRASDCASAAGSPALAGACRDVLEQRREVGSAPGAGARGGVVGPGDARASSIAAAGDDAPVPFASGVGRAADQSCYRGATYQPVDGAPDAEREG